MTEDPLWARIALLLNLLGTILLALSFQATSSDVRIVTVAGVSLSNSKWQPDPHATKVIALCTSDRTLIAEGHDTRGAYLALSAPTCPDFEHSRSAAVVNAEHPYLFYYGLLLNGLGFLMQFFAVPRRKTLAELNEQLRILRKQKKQLEIQQELDRHRSPVR